MKSLLKTLTASLMLTSALSAMAVPAKPGLIPVEQPDGTVINVRIHGDEYHHFYTSEDGYYLVRDNDQFYYANVDANGRSVSSGIKATPAASRTQQARQYLSTVDMNQVLGAMQRQAQARESKMARTMKLGTPAFMSNVSSDRQKGVGLFPGTHFPPMGEQKGLVILVEYKDVKMSLDDAKDYFTRMLNEPGFNDYGGTGSAVDFFTESSNGQFIPTFDVYGPVTLSKNRSYYGGNDWYGNDANPAEMVYEACNILDDQIDFTDYDRDGDGIVDNVFIFYAGRGEASGGSEDTVWPHAWNVEYGIGFQPEYDGVKVSRYACSNEWESGRPDGVGTFVHEFSHVMGLPDLYATSYTSSFTPGSWSCMDYGPYNNDGMTPPLYGAFERYALGWMEPMEIKDPVNAVLPAISSNKAGIVKASENEFFLFENRQQTGWDAYLPGHGMLVWHVDYNESVWDSNRVNNTPSHQYVDIEEADGTQSEYSRSGDAFPGTANKTSFSDSGTPNMKTWGGRGLNTPLTEIAENDGVITFKAKGGRTEPLVGTEALEAIDWDDESFTAAWKPVEGASYAISVYTDDGNGQQFILNDKFVGDVTSYKVEGLEADTEYYYYVKVSNGWEYSDPSNVIKVSTGAVPLNKKAVVAVDATDINDNGFTANWELLPEANDYLVTVNARTLTGHNHEVVDFTDGVESLPAGWTSSSKSSYLNEAYSGAAIPSLRMSRSEDYIASGEYAEPLISVSFWHRGNNTSDDAKIVVIATTPEGEKTVQEIAVSTADGGVTTVVDLEGLDAKAVKLSFVRTGTRGSLALDDIDVAYGLIYEDVPVAEYQDVAAGNNASLAISGLNPGSLYTYSVKATDGTLTSRVSNIIEVETTGTAGVKVNVASTQMRVITANGMVIVTGMKAGSVVRVYDVAGRMMAVATADANGTVRIAGLNRGVYMVRCPELTVKTRI